MAGRVPGDIRDASRGHVTNAPPRARPEPTGTGRWFRRRVRWIDCGECGTANDAVAARWCGHCGNRLDVGLGEPSTGADEVGGDRSRLQRVAAPAFIALLVAGIVVPSALQGQGTPPQGQSARGDAQRRGVVATQAPVGPREVAWESEPQEIAFGTTVLSSGAGTTAVLGGDRFEVLELATGQILRTVELDATDLAYSFAGVVADLVLVPDAFGATMVAQDLRTGASLWRSPAAEFQPMWARDAKALGEDLVLQVALGTVAMVRRTDGASRWGQDLLESQGQSIHRLVDARPEGIQLVSVSPAGAELRPDSTTVTPQLQSLAPSTGEVRWSAQLHPREALGPIATSARWIAHRSLAGPNPLVAVRSLATGQQVHAVPYAGELDGLAFLGDLLLVTSSTQGLSVFDAGTGEERWASPGQGPLSVVQPDEAGDGGRIVVATDDGILGILDRDGNILGRVESGPGTPTVSIGDGVIVIATAGLAVRAHDLAGNQLWRRDLTPPAYAGLATDGQLVAVNSPAGALVLDGRTGERLTSVGRVDSGEPLLAVSGAVALDEGVVLLAPLGGVVSGRGLSALDARTGLVKWNRDGDQPPVAGSITRSEGLAWTSVGDEIHAYAVDTGRRVLAALADVPRGPVAVASDVVVATSAGGRCVALPSCQSGVVAVTIADRTQAWTSPAPACGPPALRDGRVVVPTSTGPWALGLVDGGLLWQAAGRPACGPLALGDLVAVQGSGTMVQAWHLDDGTPAWEIDLGDSLTTDPVLAGNEVVVATIDGNLHGLDVATGDLLWQFRLPSPALADPVVVGERWVVLLRDGRVVGLR